MASIFITLSTLIRFSTPSLEKDVWKDLSDNLKQELAPLHHHISRCNNPDDIKVLGDQCTIVIRNFLSNHSELFEDENKQSSKFRSHSNKTLAQLLELKKTLRKEAFKKDADPSKRKQFHNFFGLGASTSRSVGIVLFLSSTQPKHLREKTPMKNCNTNS